MTRTASWLLVAVVLFAAAGIWILRATRVTAAQHRTIEEMVRRGWTESRLVALEGVQDIQVEQGKPLRAKILTSRTGGLRIEYLSEPLKGVTLWENAERTYRYHPGESRLTVEKRTVSPDEEAGREVQFLRNYTIRQVGMEQVAGRATVVADLRPRSGKGGWKRVWLDRETAVILRSDAHDSEGEVLRSTRFVSVRYLTPSEEPGDAAFAPPEELRRRHETASESDSQRLAPAELGRRAGFRVRVPSWLPRGYTLTGAYETPCPCSTPHPAVRLEFSDGLNTLSLFECGSPRCRSTRNCFADDNAAPIAVRAEQGGVYYLAVGDLSRADLDRLIRSAR